MCVPAFGERGVGAVQVVAPSDVRRLVLAAVDDEWEARSLASALRAEGMVAVTRPDAGVRLEAWMRDTRPLTFGDRLSVCLAWSEHDRGDGSRLVEVGVGGFGSGEHPSTRLVVEQLVARINGGERSWTSGAAAACSGCARCDSGRRASWPPTSSPTPSTRPDATPPSTACSGQVEATRAPLARSRTRSTSWWRTSAGRHWSSSPRARPARGAGRMARREWHLALTVFARRRVPPSARGARAPDIRGVVSRRARPPTLKSSSARHPTPSP